MALVSIVLFTHTAPPQDQSPQSGPAKSLTDAQRLYLEAQDWRDRVGNGLGIWISVDEQMFRFVENGNVIWEIPCATAANGTGSEMNSLKTPLGWHVVARKTGEGEPWGRVFRSGKATSKIWKPGDDTKEDLVLTRVLFLDGLEPDKNKGGKVDSMTRCIYIHGTNAEHLIGTPSSHGCIRLRNDDVIEAYERIPEGTPVLITEKKTKK